MREPKLKGKSYDIPKRLVWDAWLKVKENGGAAGPDGVTIEQFGEDLSRNLYRLWNRMSSGSYFPGPVRAVEIPKKGKQGGVRVLGIPNVVDRVAETAATMALEPSVEPVFHEDSYGYRPGRSPVDAVAVCRERCFKKNWVVDLDIRAFLVPSSHCQRVHAVVSKRAYSACGTSIRRPFRRPLRTWMASSSPRFTRCNTVWRLTPSIRIASAIGT
jgi:retron-type reverse transcriptase